jgi:hypothetical protein
MVLIVRIVLSSRVQSDMVTEFRVLLSTVEWSIGQRRLRELKIILTAS